MKFHIENMTFFVCQKSNQTLLWIQLQESQVDRGLRWEHALISDYEMKLLLPAPNKLPTDAELECSWGDGTTYNTLVRKTLTQILYTYNISIRC